MASLLTDTHYNAFGRITYGYASVEVGIKFCVAGMMQVSLHNSLIASSQYSAYSLNAVAKSLADETLTPELATRMRKLVDRWFEFTAIRTAVAHHRWRKGERPDSIRPTFFDTRTGRAEVRGFREGEKDYTADELLKIVADIHKLNEDVKTFLKESGLDDIIEEKTALESDDSDSSDGTT